MYAGIFNLKAKVYINLNSKDPITAKILLINIEDLLYKVLPIRSEARDIVSIPEPISILTDF